MAGTSETNPEHRREDLAAEGHGGRDSTVLQRARRVWCRIVDHDWEGNDEEFSFTCQRCGRVDVFPGIRWLKEELMKRSEDDALHH